MLFCSQSGIGIVAVDLSLLPDAVEVGAVCLDGSPPAYNFDKGSDTGVNHWLIHLEGGGWCESKISCAQRSMTYLGSSLKMNKSYDFPGILSASSKINPYFYNWNRVLLRYCDGGSFSGNIDAPVLVQLPGESKARTIYFRGERIWKALVEHLLLLGMNLAEKALLAGTSAGALASLIHCDSFREFVPIQSEVKCLSDAGFFIDVVDVGGERSFRRYFGNVVDTQNITDALPDTCTQRYGASQCFFPAQLIRQIKSPFFILNAAYDSWQWNNVLVPSSADPKGEWSLCKKNLMSCSTKQVAILQEFRKQLVEALGPSTLPIGASSFLLSCVYHNIAFDTRLWATPSSQVGNKTAAVAVGEWYFEANNKSTLDCPYPCNTNCKGVLL
ncbi:hypothetical protein GOP47_0015240 [Adiantum capillus-veneris]|uniref:Pectin acetylesterase n=1 Tax=Adiantum capillus-veneris TaxID=13818 RepID=A0A9D4UK14_ADICA|nr:hypothetical protein GOP47_0015240 [Adiantum capillus-veneris]